MKPLVHRIIAVRLMIAGLEGAKRPDRDLIMRHSIYLGGLEEAAKLTLGQEDLVALDEHQRTAALPA